MPARLELGPLLAAAGALALAVSLFLDWYDSFTAWESFELVDALVAGLALATLLTALMQTGLLPATSPLGLELLAAATLILVGLQLIDPPPAVGEAEREIGAWLALGGALAIVAGTVLSSLRLSVQVSVAPRSNGRERPAVDRRDPAVPPPADRPPPTQPMSPEEITGRPPADRDAT